MPLLVPDPDQARAGDAIRAKWMWDGAATLEEAAELAEYAASRLRLLAAAGWTLMSPIEDDHGQLVDPYGNAGAEEEEDF